MSIKEKPLIEATKNPDALPGFLFIHPIFTGFFAMVMAICFVAVATLFWSLHGRALETFEAVRIGAIFGIVFASTIYVGIFFSAFKEPEEKSFRIQFVFGGLIAVILMVLLDWRFTEKIRAHIAEDGYLICTSQTPNCD